MDRELTATVGLRSRASDVIEILRVDPFAAIAHDDEEIDRINRTFRSDLAVGLSSGATVHQDVTVTIGVPTGRPGEESVHLGWTPVGREHVVPHFDGDLTVRCRDDGGCDLTVTGKYHVPLGVIGALGDVIFARNVATSSFHEFVDRVAHRLDAHAIRHRQQQPLKPRPYSLDLRDVSDPEEELR